ncbi:MAG: DUF456 domain-containing protein [Kiritimatiellae bacterium]|nr:DUF456 domain-containing protein [Kiritimatiellia bacterium]
MTDILLIALGAICLLVGFVGCVVPVLPGVACAYAALWTLCPTPHALTGERLLGGGVVAAVAIVLDYVVPAVGARKFDCTRWGVFGCMAGTVAGMFFAPFGIILGPFLGAVAGELVAGKAMAGAMRGGIGAMLGFLAGVALKFAACALFTWWFVQACRA